MLIIDAATIQQIKQKSGLTFQHAKDYAKLSELIEKETSDEGEMMLLDYVEGKLNVMGVAVE